MGGLHGLRCPALVPHLQPGDPEREVRSGGQVHRALRPRADAFAGQTAACPWLAKPLELAEAGIALGRDYPLPVVDHAAAREKTLARYGILKKES